MLPAATKGKIEGNQEGNIPPAPVLCHRMGVTLYPNLTKLLLSAAPHLLNVTNSLLPTPSCTMYNTSRAPHFPLPPRTSSLNLPHNQLLSPLPPTPLPSPRPLYHCLPRFPSILNPKQAANPPSSSADTSILVCHLNQPGKHDKHHQQRWSTTGITITSLKWKALSANPRRTVHARYH